MKTMEWSLQKLFIKDGKENGDYFLYNTNGTYRTKGAYIMGKPVGLWEYYDKDGKLKDKSYSKLKKKLVIFLILY